MTPENKRRPIWKPYSSIVDEPMVAKTPRARAFCALAFLSTACGPPLPTDQALVRQFGEQHALLDTLANMAVGDEQQLRPSAHGEPFYVSHASDVRSGRISGPIATLPRARLEQYTRILAALKTHRGFRVDSTEFVTIMADRYFFSHAPGFWTQAGEAKGFARRERPPQELDSSLDIPDDQDCPGRDSYKHLDGNWYLYLACK